MVRHSFGIFITVLVSAILVGAIPSSAGEAANQWQVTANGSKGLLELSSQPGGRINGTLLGSSVEGWLVDRHLVLIRESDTGPETWEAWFATPENVNGDNQPILAGTFLRPGEGGPLPWFGTSLSVVAESGVPLAAPLAPVAAQQSSQENTSGSQAAVLPPSSVKAQAQQPTLQEIPSVATPAPVPHLPSGKPSLAGTWDTPDGPLTIRQNGSSLVFVLPDREVSGRLTGVENLFGGFGPGCCKGLLEQAAAVITWDNGVRWQRQ